MTKRFSLHRDNLESDKKYSVSGNLIRNRLKYNDLLNCFKRLLNEFYCTSHTSISVSRLSHVSLSFCIPTASLLSTRAGTANFNAMIWSLAVLKRLRVIRYLLEIGFFLICNAISDYKAKRATRSDLS